jgi:hypothetical protein
MAHQIREGTRRDPRVMLTVGQQLVVMIIIQIMIFRVSVLLIGSLV